MSGCESKWIIKLSLNGRYRLASDGKTISSASLWFSTMKTGIFVNFRLVGRAMTVADVDGCEHSAIDENLELWSYRECHRTLITKQSTRTFIWATCKHWCEQKSATNEKLSWCTWTRERKDFIRIHLYAVLSLVTTIEDFSLIESKHHRVTTIQFTCNVLVVARAEN